MTDESVRYALAFDNLRGLFTSINPRPFFQSALDSGGIFSDSMLWILKHLSDFVVMTSWRNRVRIPIMTLTLNPPKIGLGGGGV
jgi:hypothetical protein